MTPKPTSYGFAFFHWKTNEPTDAAFRGCTVRKLCSTCVYYFSRIQCQR